MPAVRLSRRRALATGVAGALGVTLSRLPAAPAWAAPRPRARGFGLDLARGAFGADGTTGVLRARRRFDLVGVRGADVEGLEVRVRRRGGAWSPWVPLGHGAEHRPDAGTGRHATDPVWTGGSDELQLRRRGRRTTGPLRVQLVAVSGAAKRRGARATAAASRRAKAAQGGPPPIIARSAWGGDAVKPRATPSYGAVQVGFVHHTVGANDYTPEQSAGIVLGIAKYHRDSNGWNDLGYNFLVDRFGQVFEGRAGGIDQAVIGAQAQGYNAQSTGVSVLGTYGSVAASPEAVDAVARLLAWKLPLHGAPVEGTVVVESAGGGQNRFKAGTPVTLNRISGHRDGDQTSCPGNALYAQLPEIRRRAAAIAPTVSTAVARLSMDPPPKAPTYGAALAVAGRLVRGDGGPVAGQRVTVQKRGARSWVTVGKATTGDDGAWRAEVTWRKGGRLRARAAVPGAPVAVTPTVELGVTPVAELEAAAPRIRAGGRVALDLRLAPVTSAALLVERQVGERWVRVAKVPVRAKRSRSRVRVALRRAGLYRITLRAQAGSVAVRSAPVTVRAVSRNGSLEAPAPPSTPGSGTGGTGGVASGA
ncbi:peptidoglycan recognition protein [Conexibacter sp. SYSU D00693]|uniref:peptidoglycan recognition protein family protein n=1 Tax=Conexibacter sp. SYSU D00693 TaxID=2812560 RepID=UPI00196B468F|nr:peptidoglycan recognition protein [Conexibacter sp. SYSU D00693]